ncbi:peptidoglycan/xylan/chitin deacetylase (PgdA/CDA1 family) [Deinococcus metalli]|uniref:Lipoprotein n=1 Tax=Deinococcus metalli TaxID=1141878 RepID=A0A7W8KEW8_9DEIO|nr:polysaccharide deacetylase family protein [Deinococcus metalli]MBB5376899.1 peptidoglycan/xylan/chitin deacetylase (PgdA/CDA1 family) [Deinococcus metalli]GHF46186.1 lipoprotein [Deinococcus metalli]
MRALLLALLALSGVAGAIRPSLDAPGVITHGPRALQDVALTFDADMTPGMEQELRSGRVRSFDNEAVVRVLEQAGIPATFFLTGMWAQVYPASARAMAHNPLFEIEDHSYDHPGFAQPCYGLAGIAPGAKAPDILRAQRAISQATGDTPRYFRFPGGCATAADVALAHAAGLQVVHWDVVGGDVNQPDPAVIVRQTLRAVQGGSIVVLHVSGGHAPATALALPGIIAGLRQEGYRFVTVQALLGAPATHTPTTP